MKAVGKSSHFLWALQEWKNSNVKAQIERIKISSNFDMNFENKRFWLDLSWFWNAHSFAFWLLLFGLKLFFSWMPNGFWGWMPRTKFWRSYSAVSQFFSFWNKKKRDEKLNKVKIWQAWTVKIRTLHQIPCLPKNVALRTELLSKGSILTSFF